MRQLASSVPSPLRWSWGFAGATVPLAFLALLAAFPLMMVGSCFAWICGLIAVIVGLRVLVRSLRARRQAPTETSEQVSPLAAAWPHVLGGVIALLILQLGLTWLNLLALGAVREASKAVVSRANLMGLDTAVACYGEDYGGYAATLRTFVDIEFSSYKSFISPFDPHRPSDWSPDQPLYSSYAYVPGKGDPVDDPLLVIAYEREPYCSSDARIFAEHKRYVLFGNGKVHHLSEAEFEAALDADHRRRQELGWLAPESLPEGTPPIR